MAKVVTAKYMNNQTARCVKCKGVLRAESLAYNPHHIYHIGTMYECVCGKSKVWTNSIRDPVRLLAFWDGVITNPFRKEPKYTEGFCNDKYCGFTFTPLKVLKNGFPFKGAHRMADLMGNPKHPTNNQIAFWFDMEWGETDTEGLMDWYKDHREDIEELMKIKRMKKSADTAPAKVMYKGRVYEKVAEVNKCSGCEKEGEVNDQGLCGDCSTPKTAAPAKKFGKCPYCKGKMEIGDETPEERMCDKCAAKGVKPKGDDAPSAAAKKYCDYLTKKSIPKAKAKKMEGTLKDLQYMCEAIQKGTLPAETKKFWPGGIPDFKEFLEDTLIPDLKEMGGFQKELGLDLEEGLKFIGASLAELPDKVKFHGAVYVKEARLTPRGWPRTHGEPRKCKCGKVTLTSKKQRGSSPGYASVIPRIVYHSVVKRGVRHGIRGCHKV